MRRALDDELTELITSQHGMVARRQLRRYGIDADRVRNQIAAGRWVEHTPRVIGTLTGELTQQQREWLAVLHAGPASMLGGLSAARVHGLTGWDRDVVTVYVDDELSFEPVPGIRFFRSRRPFSLLRSPRPGVPTCHLEPAVLLFAGYTAVPRTGHAAVAAIVQRRLTTPERCQEWIHLLKPLARAKALRATLTDIAGGAQSGAELDVRRLCRRFGISRPRSQQRRTDNAGRVRWTDCEWVLADGRVLVLEVDGSFHLDVLQWADDLRRSRRLTTARRTVVRCTAFELRHEPDQVAGDLIALGVPGRVPDDAA